MTSQQESVWRDMWTGFLLPTLKFFGPALIAVFVMIAALQRDAATLHLEYLDRITTIRSGYEMQIGEMEQELTIMQDVLFELELQIAVMRLKQEASGGTAADQTIKRMLDAMPGPAWCKRIIESEEEVRFVMFHINDHYEFEYNISAERYVGKEDKEIHAPADAANFRRNDLIVYQNRASITVDETVGYSDTQRFWKFYVPAPIEQGLVCGLQITGYKLDPNRSTLKDRPNP